MRISDWSSDVCSSDLGNPARGECANEEDRAGHCTAVAKGKGHPPQAEPHQRETANIHRIAGDHRRHWQLQVFGLQRCFEGILCAFTQNHAAALGASTSPTNANTVAPPTRKNGSAHV